MKSIKTYGVDYLGAKTKIIPHIIEVIDKVLFNKGKVIDIFTGTSRVAQALKMSGYTTYTGDLNDASRVYSNAMIHFGDFTYLQPHIDKMNTFLGYDGWLTNNYSGQGNVNANKEFHRLMQPKNSRKADEARDYVEDIFKNNKINELEKDVLICSIIFGIDKVDNTVGNQHAYLHTWGQRAHGNISFSLPPIIEGPIGGNHIHGDCLTVKYPEAELAYLDPPYTPSVPYHEYYHAWDSITKWDKPKTVGKSRRRIDRSRRGNEGTYDNIFKDIPWYDIKNKDNIKNNKAYNAFELMVDNQLSHIPNILISYSNQSILSPQNMIDLLSARGELDIITIDHKRNIMGKLGTKAYKDNKSDVYNPNITEYLFLLQR